MHPIGISGDAFVGEYDIEYFTDRARIGKLHDMLGMPIKLYLDQYGVYYQLIHPIVAERSSNRCIDQLRGLTDGG